MANRNHRSSRLPGTALQPRSVAAASAALICLAAATGCALVLGLERKLPDRDGDTDSFPDGDDWTDGLTCTTGADCDDGDPCNGEETCNVLTGSCESGERAGDGTLCIPSPRHICLDGACVESSCGDCFLDRGNGEFCDDCNEDPDDGCDTCRLKCTDDADCQDGDLCNGDEVCDAVTGYCRTGELLQDGTECGESPRRICISGLCSESICGDGFLDEEGGEACDGDPARSCTSSCGTEGSQRCAACAWAACEPPDETCNGIDDDCDDVCDNGFACCAGERDETCLTCTVAGIEGSRICSGDCGWGACCTDRDPCNGCDDDCDGDVDTPVNRSGELRLTNASNVSGHPSAAYNFTAGHYAVAWHDARDGAAQVEIYMALVSSQGEKLTGDMRVTNAPVYSLRPSIVYASDVYGLAWADDRNFGSREIYFGRVDEGGGFVGGEHRITNTTNGSDNPSLVFTGSEFAIAWEDERNGGDNQEEIFFIRLSSTGSPIGGEVRVTNAAGISVQPSLVFTGSGFGVAWMDSRDGNSEIYFKRIGMDGTPVDPDVRITNDPGESTAPSLAFNGSEFGLAWVDGRSGGGTYFARIDTAGTKLGGDVRTSGAADASPIANVLNRVSLVWSAESSRYGILWHEDWDADGTIDVSFLRLEPDGTPVGSEIRVSDGPADSVQQAMAWGGDAWVAAWRDYRFADTEIFYAVIGCEPF